MAYIRPIKGPKGKIVTAYAVINADTGEEIARYRIRHEGHGYWRHALNLARDMLTKIKASSPYGEWCRDPNLCLGKGYCPRDPTCGD